MRDNADPTPVSDNAVIGRRRGARPRLRRRWPPRSPRNDHRAPREECRHLHRPSICRRASCCAPRVSPISATSTSAASTRESGGDRARRGGFQPAHFAAHGSCGDRQRRARSSVLRRHACRLLTNCSRTKASAASPTKGKTVGVPGLGRADHMFAVASWPPMSDSTPQGHPLGHQPDRPSPAGALRGGQDRRIPRPSARAPGTPRPRHRSCDRQQHHRPPMVAVFLLHAGRQPRIRAQISGRDQTRDARHPQSRRSLRH